MRVPGVSIHDQGSESAEGGPDRLGVFAAMTKGTTMNDCPSSPLHRHYLHYSELPYSQRVLYTATLLILGLGYFFALLNLYFTYAGRAGGNP